MDVSISCKNLSPSLEKLWSYLFDQVSPSAYFIMCPSIVKVRPCVMPINCFKDLWMRKLSLVNQEKTIRVAGNSLGKSRNNLKRTNLKTTNKPHKEISFKSPGKH
ncbi:hypothetical protein VNO77_21429 [Canavalia gladiata]|uniref:Uncharacterized protein n=1 Tax=Canavalia gladiata TaxID=3824 RepID=A0AAN9LW51_CANGL